MAMSIEPNHLDHVVRTLGASILNLELLTYEGGPGDLSSGFTWAGLVQIGGDFTGGFAIRCGTHAAEALAKGLLQEDGKLSDEQLQTTLTELAHLMAGALSPLIEGEVILAPARSMQGAAVSRMGATSRVEARSLYEIAGETMEVALFRS